MKISGPWSNEQISRFLKSSDLPVRIATGGPHGWPAIVSLWYLYEEGFLWCATTKTARTLRRLGEDARCGFEISTSTAPYCGVRGQGRARVMPERGARVLEKLVDRYLNSRHTPFAHWLLSRSESEVAIRIEPKLLTSWDYSGRMS